MSYQAAEDRYDATTYRHTGRSGLQLPPLSLGLWQNHTSATGKRQSCWDER